MYNLRYHVASLVAVFVALSVGLLLGSIVVERGMLSSQRTTLIEGLQVEFDNLRAEAKVLQTANDSLSSFSAEALPSVVDGALAGRTVVVVASPDNADTAARASEAIRMAGGKVANATFAGPGFSLTDNVVTAVATNLHVETSSVTATRVVEALTFEWSTPGAARTMTKSLIDAGALKMQGLAATTTAMGVVVTAAFDGKPDAWALRLAQAMTDDTRFGVGVDTTKRSDGSAAAAKAAGLSGVDDVDSTFGKVSLAWVLSGRAAGLFGTGKDASAPYPSPLFP